MFPLFLLIPCATHIPKNSLLCSFHLPKSEIQANFFLKKLPSLNSSEKTHTTAFLVLHFLKVGYVSIDCGIFYPSN